MEIVLGLVVGFIIGFIIAYKAAMDLERGRATGKAFEVDGVVYRMVEQVTVPRE